ncbi:MAG TPA: PQQ-binding-like beta-propeller repeat protein [Vicinamibacterales bacterium]|jgi:quinoprotein glucose dehydrogenase
MSRRLWIVPIAAFGAGVLWIAPLVHTQNAAPPSTKNGEWPAYTADLHGSKYSPLDQINAANFNHLEVAWRFKTDNLGTRPEYKLEGTPLMVKGVLYTTGGTRRSVVALDAKTGEVMWVHSYREGQRAAIAPRQLSGRGVSYWTDGKGDDRVLYVTTGYRLIALNAHTGAMITSFGSGGVVDLKEGAVFGNRQPIDKETGEIGLHATPTVTKDLVIVGSSFKEGMTVMTHNNTKGLVRAFDVRTGKLVWTFNTIPRPGELGNDTWENDSWAVNGNTGVWTQISVDEDAGLAYLPVETPTSDFYGGHRPGANLFAESIVAVDLKTGQRKWHYQLIHHGIWDHDNSSASLLVDANVDGRPRKLLAQPTKQGWLYVFDRISGQPIWPIEEKPVPASDVPGEKAWPTQPIPTRPAPYSRTFVATEDLIDFTPALRQQALDNLKNYRWEQSPYVPLILGNVTGKRGTINIGNTAGGVNWPGSSFDPETGIAYVQAANGNVTSGSLRTPPPGFSDIRYVSGVEGTEFRVAEGPGFGSAADAPRVSASEQRLRQAGGRGAAGRGAEANNPPQQPNAAAPGGAAPAAGRGAGPGGNPLNPQGLPLVKPPYGVVVAIDLNNGNTIWRVPHGDTPDNVRNHPALQGMTIPKTGQSGSVGLMVTKTLVVAGDPQVTAPPGRPRGAMLRAYDKKSGQEVGAVLMPAPQSGSPMTYSVDGRQYMVVAVSGGNFSGEYIAFALPQNEIRSTNQQQH